MSLLSQYRMIALFLLIALSASNGAPTTPTMTDSQIMAYLVKYGYLENELDNMADISVKEALRTFQHKMGVKTPTGDMDASTHEMMLKPRCGIADFKTRESKWGRKQLTYKINSYASRIPDRSAMDQVFRQAFDFWSAVTDLTFVHRTSGPIDIDISFEVDNHHDNNAFDGKGGTLAHAFYPQRGDAHFDDAEKWSLVDGGTNLLQVATHEFGHSLGLGHSDVKGATMYPTYNGYQRNFKLHADDIDGIQYLYGPKTVQATTPTPPRNSLRGKYELCRYPSIDAAMSTPDQRSYFFKGMQFWEVNSQGLVDGYPRMINSRWPELPRSLEAAYTNSRNNKTYFFKDMVVWRYSGDTLDNGYPRKISEEFPGLYLNNIDAAFEWSRDKKIHFFRGDKHWCHADGKICPGYPIPLSAWGLPDKVDAAIRYYYQGYRMYFFKDTQFYRFSDESLNVTRESPLSTEKRWLLCPT